MIEPDVGTLRVSCWIRWVQFAILPATILTMSASVMADAICITSPNHPQTFTYGAMIWHELYLQCTAHELAARITFSNVPYAGDDAPPRDEAFDLRFPGDHCDSARRAYVMNDRQGQR